MAKVIYDVRLQVAEENLGTVVSTLAGSSTIVSITPTQASAQIPTSVSKPAHPGSSTGSSAHKAYEGGSRWAGGKRNKGITGPDLVMKIMGSSDRVFDMVEIANEFVAHGFARTSAHATLSKMVADKKVRALGNAKFCLPGATIKMGAAHPAESWMQP